MNYGWAKYGGTANSRGNKVDQLTTTTMLDGVQTQPKRLDLCGCDKTGAVIRPVDMFGLKLPAWGMCDVETFLLIFSFQGMASLNWVCSDLVGKGAAR